jgi:acyl transferase domain-containing protein
VDYTDADPAAPDKTYGRRVAVIDGFNFDWKNRFVPKLTVETADIAHWLALETAIAALEDAGLSRESAPIEKSGVILGNTLTGEQTRATAMRQRWPFVRKALRAAARSRGLGEAETEELALCMQDYFQSVFAPTTEDTLSGGLSNTIAGRICNYFNFHGGGYTVDGACSSSLIAVATAATALANGDMDFILAGGVDVSLDTFELVGFAKIGALTPGDMAVYDKRGNGFIPGEGCGFVALKRLEDARAARDRVYAVIRGWGISSDGKGGLTAPSRDGQAMALRRAYRRAGYEARDVDFFEGHGTGTTVGDRIEIEGIALAVGATQGGGLRAQGLTSVKSLIGHTKAAAGVAGLIKASLAVYHRVLPPTAGCRDRNAAFEESAPTLYPVLQGEIRPREALLRAGVSAMGFGGINCHVTLESGDRPAPPPTGALDPRALIAHAQDAEIFVFSAESPRALRDRARQAREKAYGLSLAEMADFAAWLARDSGAGAFRAALVARNPDDLDQGLERLEALLADGRESQADSSLVFARADRKKPLAFVFPGQGSQQPGMGRALVERHAFAREIFAQAQDWIAEAGGEPIAKKIFPPLDRAGEAARKDIARDLARTEIAQPAICVASLLWLAFLRRLGLKPDVVAGHSLGELTAFHAAGAFDAETLIKLATLRGRAMSARPEAAGAMASLSCDADKARALIQDIPEVIIANCNSPRQTVISGAAPAVAVVAERAERAMIAAKALPVSNAFHSPFVAGAAALLGERADLPEKPQRLDAIVLSGRHGAPVGPNCGLRGHFSSQVTAPVDFIAVANNIAPRAELIVEVGPGQVLTGLLRDSLPDATCMPVASLPDNWRDLLLALAHIYCGGHEVNWPELFADRLIRPFTSAAEKHFIENPCERPFRPSKNWAPMDFDGGALAARAGLSQAEWSDYLRRRGAFLAKIIRADFDDAPSVAEPGKNPVVEAAPAAEAPPTVEQVAAETVSIEARLISMVARSTGYPAESITADMRLLDHLNLDSIKAGELVAAAAKFAGVAGALDASAFANASLLDIANALREASVGTAEAAPAAEALPARWVRCFKVEHLAQELAQAEADWSGARALILHETAEADVAKCLVERLRAARAGVLAQTFEKARQENAMAGAGFTHRVVLLPRRAEQDDLARAVERLAMLSATPRHFGDGANSLALAQFGGGRFGAGAASPASSRSVWAPSPPACISNGPTCKSARWISIRSPRRTSSRREYSLKSRRAAPLSAPATTFPASVAFRSPRSKNRRFGRRAAWPGASPT